MIKIQKERINVEKVEKSLKRKDVGAIVLFLGEPRSSLEDGPVVAINYSAYTDMALHELNKIEKDTKEKFDIKDIIIIHRIGVIPLKEISFLVAVSSLHRNEGFEACKWVVNEVKSKVPIWKEIIYEGNRNS